MRPWTLQTAISPDLDCRIYVPSNEDTIEHATDDQVCVCTRQKANLADRNLQTDIRQTYMDMLEDFQNEAIEDWRFKTRIQTNSVLTELEEDIVPTHTRIDKQKIQELSNSYLSSDDLTTLKPEFSKTRTIIRREQNGGRPCGKTTESRECNTQSCPGGEFPFYNLQKF